MAPPTRPPVTAVVWFRRDLRLADHPALRTASDEAAARGGRLLALFVLDPALLDRAGANRTAYLADALAALDGDLDGSLVLRTGRPEVVVPAVAAEVGASTVVGSGDCAPYGRRRDRRVADALAADGRTLALVGSPYAVAPGRVRTGSGDPYRVFTPFARAWRAHGWPPPTDRPAGVRWARVDGDDAPAGLRRRAAATGPVSPDLPPAGEAAAHVALEAFLDGPVDDYAEDRDRPDRAGTSRLSPHLRFGAVHPRQVLAALGDGPGADTFRSELAWREFYADVLWHRPDSAWAPLQPAGRHLRWDTGPTADERFAAWAAGRTGVPLVDAGMRQLVAEGWMHNRLRMLTASYLVKDLHLDWRRGARHFLDLLVDGDLASNNHGWQWVAGTGTDAAPFHRIFNPDVQARRVDPDGAYVARWAPGATTADAPRPLVDHAVERVEALARWRQATEAARAAGDRPTAG